MNISLKDIKKSIHIQKDEIPILNGIDIRMSDNKILAIMGPSGSGKSTLLNIIGCLDLDYQGEYFCNGTNIRTLSSKQYNDHRKQNISFVFQQFVLLKQYTIYENIEMPLKVKGISRKMRKMMVDNVIERYNLKELSDRLPTQLSGGQQQLVAIARAVVTNNELILADEPTGSLDQKTGEMIMNTFVELAQSGKSIIIVTHDANVARFADDIIYIKDGRNESV